MEEIHIDLHDGLIKLLRDLLATVLTQLKLGQEIPEELYKAIGEMSVYFLHFDPSNVAGGRTNERKPEPAAGSGGETQEG